MSKQGKSDASKQEAIERLHKAVQPGDTVYTVLRHVSRSGMQREISLVAIDRLTAADVIARHAATRTDALGDIGRDAYVTLDYWASRAIGWRLGKHDGIVVGGVGMDAGFWLVYSLGLNLWPHGTPKPHGRRNGEPDRNGGYALKQRWL